MYNKNNKIISFVCLYMEFFRSNIAVIMIIIAIILFVIGLILIVFADLYIKWFIIPAIALIIISPMIGAYGFSGLRIKLAEYKQI